jgi:predicted O-linked N-acetylglucosamine transferase (SPINDLY family)
MKPPKFDLEPPSGTGTGAGGLSSLDRYTQAIQNMLTSGSYRKPQDDLLAKLTEMYGQAQPRINTAMDDLSSFLGAQINPYAGLQAQTTQATPALSELLQSQGVDQTPLQQLAAVTQAQNTGQSDAFQNLIGSMQGMWQGNQAGQIRDVASQRADLQTQLQNSLLGAGTQLNTKAAGQQQDLMTMLLTALSKGGKPKKGALL